MNGEDQELGRGWKDGRFAQGVVGETRKRHPVIRDLVQSCLGVKGQGNS